MSETQKTNGKRSVLDRTTLTPLGAAVAAVALGISLFAKYEHDKMVLRSEIKSQEKEIFKELDQIEKQIDRLKVNVQDRWSVSAMDNLQNQMIQLLSKYHPKILSEDLPSAYKTKREVNPTLP